MVGIRDGLDSYGALIIPIWTRDLRGVVMPDKIKVKNYDANATLAQLSNSCQTDEDAFQGRIISIERVEADDGQKATRVTYQRIPFSEVYVTKQLFFFDITDLAPEKIQDISTEQLKQGHALASFPNSDNADVYLNGSESQIAVYREG
jgi:hypothetical protein